MMPAIPLKRATPPIWLMGFCNLPVGLSGAVALVTVPQLLAARGVPETAIAGVTALALVAGIVNFLFAPLLDWRFSRRAYSMIFAGVTGLLTLATLTFMDNLPLLAGLAFLLTLASSLNQAAVGGWLSHVTAREDKNALGAWLQLANISGFGVGAALAIVLVRALPPVVGPAAVGLLNLVPIAIALWIPPPATEARLIEHDGAAFLRDLVALIRQPSVRWLILFLALPAASFALSNTLTGLGNDFGASEGLVAAIAGIGVAAGGMAGSLLAPPLIRRGSPERAFLMIGAGGAVFTLAQIVLPHSPLAFAVNLIGQNAIQAAAFATANVLMLNSIGEGNRLAATQFALLSSVIGLPLAYMQAIDGQAYGAGGLTGAYLTDALLSLAACAILGLLLRRRGRAAATPALLATAPG
jgi:PAT family beta-lactamase induction signal transducer AmpG